MRQKVKMGPNGCPETSIRKYHSLLSNIPEQHSFHLNVFISTSKLSVNSFYSLQFVQNFTTEHIRERP